MHDVHSDEDDSFDETIYPLDFQDFEGESGQLKDDVSLWLSSICRVAQIITIILGHAQFACQAIASQMSIDLYF